MHASGDARPPAPRRDRGLGRAPTRRPRIRPGRAPVPWWDARLAVLVPRRRDVDDRI